MAIDVGLLELFNNGFYSARLTAKQYDEVRRLGFFAGVTLYDGRQSVPTTADGLTPAAAGPPPRADQKRLLTFDIRLHPDGDVTAVKAWLEAKSVAVAGTSARKLRIYVLEDSAVLGELATLTDVQSLQEFVPPKLFNDRARTLLGVDHTANPLPFDGAGEIVAIADTGLDEQHPDLPPARIVTVIARGRPGNASDPSGHGTHVAGLAVGDWSASNGGFKGVAPGAKLVFQSLLDGNGQLGGLPLDLNELFDEVYAHGACIHNNSWGAEIASTYTSNRLRSTRSSTHTATCWSWWRPGNEGQAANRINSDRGIVDWLSIGAPATAKNALTVGASRSDRTTGGYCQYQWGRRGAPISRIRRSPWNWCRAIRNRWSHSAAAALPTTGASNRTLSLPEPISPGSGPELPGIVPAEHELRVRLRHQHGDAAGVRLRGARA